MEDGKKIEVKTSESALDSENAKEMFLIWSQKNFQKYDQARTWGLFDPQEFQEALMSRLRLLEDTLDFIRQDIELLKKYKKRRNLQ